MMLLFEKFSFQKSNKTTKLIAVREQYFLLLRESEKKKGDIVSKMRKCSVQGMHQLDCHNQYVRTLI
jgi:DNA recombination-dependent growth factor C